MPETDSKQTLEIYSLNGVVTTVRNPVRNNILHMLSKQGTASFSEIQKTIGLSKSTTSGYISSLVYAGLVIEISCRDGRKKEYKLAATPLGDIKPAGTTVSTNEFREVIRQAYTNYGKLDYKNILPHIIKVALMEAGVKIDPIIGRGGEILGETIAPYLVADTLDRTLENICGFWAHNGLGEIKIRSIMPLKLEVYKCYECMILPKGMGTSCVISSGILSALFSAFYHQKIPVIETQCMTQGFECCSFDVSSPVYEE
ncbi:MAG: ArsR family transcriptional regulator [Methanocorpusculum sp.]|nr:ArsR family transcriptional regulator [Methanocorpusculum sp.]